MKYQLSIENSEIYRNLPRYPFHKRYKNVRNDLMQLHPGFTDESIWDFQADKKGITACVISRDFYEEKRIFHPLCRFVAMEEGKKRRKKEIEFFKWAGYTRDGKRRKRKGIAITLIAVLLCVLSAGLLFAHKKIGGKTEETKPLVLETEETPRVIQGLSSLLEKCVSVINKWGGQLVYLESSRCSSTDLGNTVCRFGVYGGNVSACVQELNSIENMETASAENLNWNNGSWEYTLNCIFSESFGGEIPVSANSDYLDCFSKGETCVLEKGGKLISSVIDEGNNLVLFDFIVNQENTGASCFTELEKAFYSRECLLESLKISPFLEEGKNSFVVEAGIRKMEGFPYELEEFMSDGSPFIWKETAEKMKTEPVPDKPVFTAKENSMSAAEKKDDADSSQRVEIGRIKKGRKVVVYERNSNGKIYTRILGE